MPEEAIERRRRVRFDVPGHARFLTGACFKNQPFMRSERARQWFVEALQRARETHGFDLWAWCAMKTHFHVLIYPDPTNPVVGPILKSLKRSVTLRAVAWVEENAPEFLEKMRDVQPSGRSALRFWQRNGGHDRNMFTPKHIWEVVNYIHNNPVVEGLVKRPQDWEWSSAREYCKRGTGLLRLDLKRIPDVPPPWWYNKRR